MTHVLALDVGTTSVRALAMAEDGRIRGRATRPLPTRCPAPGRVEHDPAEMAALARDVLCEALTSARVPARELAGLGIATQRGTTVAWDAETGAPLAPAIGWQDRRAVPEALALLRDGFPIHTLASAAKLEWWLRNDPAVAAAARAGRLRVGTPDAWLGWSLTGGGAFVTDASEACCTGLYDPKRGAWSERVLSRIGVAPEWLPALVPSDAVAGETAPALLGAPVPLAARVGDQQAAAFAQGVHAPGQAKLTLGTSAMLDLHAGAAFPTPRRGSYPLVLWERRDGERAYCLEATVVTAGAAVDWLVEMGLLAAPAALDAAARDARDDGVVFVPALQGLGSPRFADTARGLVGGLTRGSGRAELARALVEGLAQRCADLCETLAPFDGPLRVDGGLARCDLLLERTADLSGLVLERAAETETTALGAAFLAALGAGVLEGPEKVRERLGEPARFLPSGDEDARRAARTRWARRVERVL